MKGPVSVTNAAHVIEHAGFDMLCVAWACASEDARREFREQLDRAGFSASIARSCAMNDRPTMRRIDEIIVGERHRRDLGDVASLAKGIEEIGLLHPIVVRPETAS